MESRIAIQNFAENSDKFINELWNLFDKSKDLSKNDLNIRFQPFIKDFMTFVLPYLTKHGQKQNRVNVPLIESVMVRAIVVLNSCRVLDGGANIFFREESIKIESIFASITKIYDYYFHAIVYCNDHGISFYLSKSDNFGELMKYLLCDVQKYITEQQPPNRYILHIENLPHPENTIASLLVIFQYSLDACCAVITLLSRIAFDKIADDPVLFYRVKSDKSTHIGEYLLHAVIVLLQRYEEGVSFDKFPTLELCGIIHALFKDDVHANHLKKYLNDEPDKIDGLFQLFEKLSHDPHLLMQLLCPLILFGLEGHATDKDIVKKSKSCCICLMTVLQIRRETLLPIHIRILNLIWRFCFNMEINQKLFCDTEGFCELLITLLSENTDKKERMDLVEKLCLVLWTLGSCESNLMKLRGIDTIASVVCSLLNTQADNVRSVGYIFGIIWLLCDNCKRYQQLFFDEPTFSEAITERFARFYTNAVVVKMSCRIISTIIDQNIEMRSNYGFEPESIYPLLLMSLSSFKNNHDIAQVIMSCMLSLLSVESEKDSKLFSSGIEDPNIFIHALNIKSSVTIETGCKLLCLVLPRLNEFWPTNELYTKSFIQFLDTYPDNLIILSNLLTLSELFIDRNLFNKVETVLLVPFAKLVGKIFTLVWNYEEYCLRALKALKRLIESHGSEIEQIATELLEMYGIWNSLIGFVIKNQTTIMSQSGQDIIVSLNCIFSCLYNIYEKFDGKEKYSMMMEQAYYIDVIIEILKWFNSMGNHGKSHDVSWIGIAIDVILEDTRNHNDVNFDSLTAVLCDSIVFQSQSDIDGASYLLQAMTRLPQQYLQSDMVLNNPLFIPVIIAIAKSPSLGRFAYTFYDTSDDQRLLSPLLQQLIELMNSPKYLERWVGLTIEKWIHMSHRKYYCIRYRDFYPSLIKLLDNYIHTKGMSGFVARSVWKVLHYCCNYTVSVESDGDIYRLIDVGIPYVVKIVLSMWFYESAEFEIADLSSILLHLMDTAEEIGIVEDAIFNIQDWEKMMIYDAKMDSTFLSLIKRLYQYCPDKCHVLHEKLINSIEECFRGLLSDDKSTIVPFEPSLLAWLVNVNPYDQYARWLDLFFELTNHFANQSDILERLCVSMFPMIAGVTDEYLTSWKCTIEDITTLISILNPPKFHHFNVKHPFIQIVHHLMGLSCFTVHQTVMANNLLAMMKQQFARKDMNQTADTWEMVEYFSQLGFMLIWQGSPDFYVFCIAMLKTDILGLSCLNKFLNAICTLIRLDIDDNSMTRRLRLEKVCTKGKVNMQEVVVKWLQRAIDDGHDDKLILSLIEVIQLLTERYDDGKTKFGACTELPSLLYGLLQRDHTSIPIIKTIQILTFQNAINTAQFVSLSGYLQLIVNILNHNELEPTVASLQLLITMHLQLIIREKRNYNELYMNMFIHNKQGIVALITIIKNAPSHSDSSRMAIALLFHLKFYHFRMNVDCTKFYCGGKENKLIDVTNNWYTKDDLMETQRFLMVRLFKDLPIFEREGNMLVVACEMMQVLIDLCDNDIISMIGFGCGALLSRCLSTYKEDKTVCKSITIWLVKLYDILKTRNQSSKEYLSSLDITYIFVNMNNCETTDIGKRMFSGFGMALTLNSSIERCINVEGFFQFLSQYLQGTLQKSLTFPQRNVHINVMESILQSIQKQNNNEHIIQQYCCKLYLPLMGSLMKLLEGCETTSQYDSFILRFNKIMQTSLSLSLACTVDHETTINSHFKLDILVSLLQGYHNHFKGNYQEGLGVIDALCSLIDVFGSPEIKFSHRFIQGHGIDPASVPVFLDICRAIVDMLNNENSTTEQSILDKLFNRVLNIMIKRTAGSYESEYGECDIEPFPGIDHETRLISLLDLYDDGFKLFSSSTENLSLFFRILVDFVPKHNPISDDTLTRYQHILLGIIAMGSENANMIKSACRELHRISKGSIVVKNSVTETALFELLPMINDEPKLLSMIFRMLYGKSIDHNEQPGILLSLTLEYLLQLVNRVGGESSTLHHKVVHEYLELAAILLDPLLVEETSRMKAHGQTLLSPLKWKWAFQTVMLCLVNLKPEVSESTLVDVCHLIQSISLNTIVAVRFPTSTSLIVIARLIDGVTICKDSKHISIIFSTILLLLKSFYNPITDKESDTVMINVVRNTIQVLTQPNTEYSTQKVMLEILARAIEVISDSIQSESIVSLNVHMETIFNTVNGLVERHPQEFELFIVISKLFDNVNYAKLMALLPHSDTNTLQEQAGKLVDTLCNSLKSNWDNIVVVQSICCTCITVWEVHGISTVTSISDIIPSLTSSLVRHQESENLVYVICTFLNKICSQSPVHLNQLCTFLAYESNPSIDNPNYVLGSTKDHIDCVEFFISLLIQNTHFESSYYTLNSICVIVVLISSSFINLSPSNEEIDRLIKICEHCTETIGVSKRKSLSEEDTTIQMLNNQVITLKNIVNKDVVRTETLENNKEVTSSEFSSPGCAVISSDQVELSAIIDVNVYSGRWKRCTPVVFKINRGKKSIADAAIQKELQTLSTLRHPRIISVLGICPQLHIPTNLSQANVADSGASTNTYPALMFEYMDKGNLRSMLTAEFTLLSWASKLSIAADICDGMCFLQECGVIHGCLISENILVDGHGRAKLAGFGSTFVGEVKIECMGTSTSSSGKTGSNSEWEREMKEEVLNFGVILWELITGKKVPWGSSDNKQSSKKNVNKLTLTKEESLNSLPILTSMMKHCIESQPQQRPSFHDLFDTLHKLQLQESKRYSDQMRSIPDGFICPITQDVMKDPVMLMDGHSYERKAIEDWLTRSNRSPLTNEILSDRTVLLDNYALKSSIESFTKNNPYN